jgi:hypothetical protein
MISNKLVYVLGCEKTQPTYAASMLLNYGIWSAGFACQCKQSLHSGT